MTRSSKRAADTAQQPFDGAIQAAQQRARANCFVGRERELASFLDLVAAGGTPRIMYVHGPGVSANPACSRVSATPRGS